MAVASAESKKKKNSPKINVDLVDALTAFRLACRNGVLSNVLFSLQNVFAIVNDDDGRNSAGRGNFSKKVLDVLVLETDSSNASALSCVIEGGHDHLIELLLSLLFVSFIEKLDSESIHCTYSFEEWFGEALGSLHPKLKSGWLSRMGKNNGFDSVNETLIEKKYTVNNILKILTQYSDETMDNRNLKSLASVLEAVLKDGHKLVHHIKSTRSKARKPKINLRSDSNRYEGLDEEWDDFNSSDMVEDASYLDAENGPMMNFVSISSDNEKVSELNDNIILTGVETKGDFIPFSCESNMVEGDWDIVSCSDADEFEEVQYSFKDALARTEKDCVKPDSFILVDSPDEPLQHKNKIVDDAFDQYSPSWEHDAEFDRDGYKYVSKGRFRVNDRLKREYMKKLQKQNARILA